MSATEPRLSREELARRGEDTFTRQVRLALRPEDDGKFVAIDVESGTFEVDEDDHAAVSRLHRRVPGRRSGSSGPGTRPPTASGVSGDPRRGHRRPRAGRPPPGPRPGRGRGGRGPGRGHRVHGGVGAAGGGRGGPRPAVAVGRDGGAGGRLDPPDGLLRGGAGVGAGVACRCWPCRSDRSRCSECGCWPATAWRSRAHRAARWRSYPGPEPPGRSGLGKAGRTKCCGGSGPPHWSGDFMGC